MPPTRYTPSNTIIMMSQMSPIALATMIKSFRTDRGALRRTFAHQSRGAKMSPHHQEAPIPHIRAITQGESLSTT